MFGFGKTSAGKKYHTKEAGLLLFFDPRLLSMLEQTIGVLNKTVWQRRKKKHAGELGKMGWDGKGAMLVKTFTVIYNFCCECNRKYITLPLQSLQFTASLDIVVNELI